MDLGSGPPPFARILAPLDGTLSSELAVRRSEHLVSLPGVRLTLFCVTPIPGTRDEAVGTLENRRRIEALEADLRSRDIDVVARFRPGLPAKEILREIDSGRHDLVVMSSRRRSLVKRAALGNTALDVLRHSPAPLLLYRPLAGLDESFFAVQRSEPAAFQKILLMLDGSKEAERILGPAQRLARAFESELILFQALDRTGLNEGRVEAARAYLSDRANAINAGGLSARVLIAAGDPVEEVLQELDGGADTVALTSRGRSFWSTTILGSVASRLLRRAEGPLLCVSSLPARAEEIPAAGRLATTGSLRADGLIESCLEE
jgi:nucleotide-binding universal stress UspA family protein